MKKEMFYVAAILISSQVNAQDSAYKSLDEVITTANKYPQKQSTTGKLISVITRETLQNNAGRTLSQVLNEQAGLIINGSQNSPGTNQTVYMRGAGASNTLILVDGIPVNDASGISNEFDLNHFSIDQVERVEVLKGSQSVLYGSDAVAGVINIITRKPAGSKPLSADLSAAGGTYGTFKGTAAISGKTSIVNYGVRYSHDKSDGFSSAYDESGIGGFDRDGYRQDVAGAQVSIQAANHLKMLASGSFSDYKAAIDDAPLQDDKNNTIHNRNLRTTLNAVYDFSKGTVTINLNLNTINRKLLDEVNTPVGQNDFDPSFGNYRGKSWFAEAFTNLRLTDAIGLLAGIDLKRQDANIETSFGSLGDDSLHSSQVSAYASLLTQPIKFLHLEFGGRLTHHSQFGSNLTWSFNPSYLIKERVKLFGNLSTGFRAPSLYNLASEYGNANLKPEQSFTAEGGIAVNNHAGTVEVRGTAFLRNIRDIIIFRGLPVAPYGIYDNGDRQKDQGFELEASFQASSKLRLTGNYSFVDGHIETKSDAGKDTSFFNLYRRPKHSGNFGLTYQLTQKLLVSTSVRLVGARTDVFFDPNSFAIEKKPLKGYYNWDAYASFRLLKCVKLYADFRNITDRRYFDLYGYNTRRFNMMLGAQVML